ncbi:P-loop containing nucleoside triphosphate hydrolase protein [Microdochium trichocladiopsis]|uniref:P-loop containing nucleoside triphosphate hydrolase protein n=1 Tax=Microdochium trichocladiopsis TaxID=1682393 RepID=A0A9P8XXW6_9PEZI|nr:P-loop containing nucleoside triphosphate hydrolase protein [Microdochium trichocladiopsis]KAH7024589.1 P-loop containing nucleoside triphosphate hydrolase protein [Microdochium trichocladiopsis]
MSGTIPITLRQLAGESNRLIDTINELCRHGLDCHVDPPQIVVVGDQYSGKSSVLSAISGIPFPVRGTTGQRFTVETAFTTSNISAIRAHVHRVDGKTVMICRDDANADFENGLLTRIIDEAGLKMRDVDGFSEDILKIEISRPDVPSLTLVELPGLSQSDHTKSPIEKQVRMHRLIEKYMGRASSIVLAVVAANSNITNLSVLHRQVFQYVKGGCRALGVITKPDLLTRGNPGEAMVQLAHNETPFYKLELGWHVLRMRTQVEKDDTDVGKDCIERHLSLQAPWSTFRHADRGAEQLRVKLSDIFQRHLQKSLPGIADAVQIKLSQLQQSLRCLGQPRTGLPEMRTFLTKIASQYQLICSQALDARYDDPFFGNLYPPYSEEERVRKFGSLVLDLNRTFTYVMRTKGSRRRILHTSSGGPDPVPRLDAKNAKQGVGFEESLESDNEEIGCDMPFSFYVSKEIRRLARAYKFKVPEDICAKDLVKELDHIESQIRSHDLPSNTNEKSSLILFRDQISPWKHIAHFHVKHVMDFAKSFVEQLMSHLFASNDNAAYYALVQNIVEPFFEARTAILGAKVDELLSHYQHGRPQPFAEEFFACFKAMRPFSKYCYVSSELFNLRFNPELLSAKGKAELLQYTRDDASLPSTTITDYEAYYQMCNRTFVDNVIILAVENCLIRQLPFLMTAEMVSTMNDDELRLLASEAPGVRLEREETRAQLQALEQAAKVLRPFRPRKQRSMYLFLFPVSLSDQQPLALQPNIILITL